MSKEMSFLILLAFLLTGCGIVTRNEIDASIILCTPNDGIDKIWKFKTITTKCNNGAEFGETVIYQKIEQFK